MIRRVSLISCCIMSKLFEFGCEQNYVIPEVLITKMVSIFGELSLLPLGSFGWGGIRVS